MIRTRLSVILLAAIGCARLLTAAELAVPPVNVPGSVDSVVTSATLNSTVCVANYSASVRPPEEWTRRLKHHLIDLYKLPGTTADYELDHRVEIAVGGSPRNIHNLWMQPIGEARMKDRLENFEHRQLCAGRISLQDAQAVFLGDFWKTYNELAPAHRWPLTPAIKEITPPLSVLIPLGPDREPEDVLQELREGRKQ